MGISRRQRFIARLAIMAMLLVSLVPTLSLAFPMQSGKTFVQDVCSTQGSKLLIQVVTTQGKQLSTLIDYTPSQKPVSLSHHLNHCPFCHMAIDAVVLPGYNPAFVLFQQAQADLALRAYHPPVIASYTPSAPITRGPPVTLSIR